MQHSRTQRLAARDALQEIATTSVHRKNQMGALQSYEHSLLDNAPSLSMLKKSQWERSILWKGIAFEVVLRYDQSSVLFEVSRKVHGVWRSQRFTSISAGALFIEGALGGNSEPKERQ